LKIPIFKYNIISFGEMASNEINYVVCSSNSEAISTLEDRAKTFFEVLALLQQGYFHVEEGKDEDYTILYDEEYFSNKTDFLYEV